MRIALFSDLHIEHGGGFALPPRWDADVVVLAGDIVCPGRDAPGWARQHFGDRPIVSVAGNHEFYDQELHAEDRRMRSEASRHGVHHLQCDAVVLHGIRFLGCTLWADLALPILDRATGTWRSDPLHAAQQVEARLRDYRLVRIAEAPSASPGEADRGTARGLPLQDAAALRFRAVHAVALHQAHRDWLARTLAQPFAGPTVVVTHHAPHAQSCVPHWAHDWISAAYVSQLPLPMFDVPVLWCHGHTHHSLDYRVGGCRIVANPRGYPRLRADGPGFENLGHDPAGLLLNIDVG